MILFHSHVTATMDISIIDHYDYTAKNSTASLQINIQ